MAILIDYSQMDKFTVFKTEITTEEITYVTATKKTVATKSNTVDCFIFNGLRI